MQSEYVTKMVKKKKIEENQRCGRLDDTGKCELQPALARLYVISSSKSRERLMSNEPSGCHLTQSRKFIHGYRFNGVFRR